MNTFLPFPDFSASAATLDRRRLNKQRSETKQILNVLVLGSTAWEHHPAVLMWKDYERLLAEYGAAVCREWRGRGYKDSLLPRFEILARDLNSCPKPPWLGDTEFHRSHQSNLVRKLPEHYAPLFPGVPSDLPYVWPVKWGGGRT